MKLIRQRERESEREMSIPGEEHVHRTLCEEDTGIFEDSGAANGAKVQLARYFNILLAYNKRLLYKI